MAAPTSSDVASDSPPVPDDRRGRALAIGGLALAITLGVAFGQVTGSLSDVATGARDVSPGAGGDTGGGGRPGVVEPPPTSVPPPTESSTTTTAAVVTTATTAVTTATAIATSDAARDPRLLVSAGGTLAPGRRGLAVRALQTRLDELGYWPGPVNGRYTELTRQAVLAFQKAEDLDGRDGVADAQVRERLAAASFGWGRSRSGTVVEIDRDRQLLLVVEDGAVRWTFHVATGPLPRGRYRVEREIDAHYEAPRGTIHRPKYFDGTVAVVGTGGAPAPPAEGCGCLSDAAMDFLWSTRSVRVGTAVLVY
jgi:putative peptidoglycan binding protein/L,D-transpeptidase-like protein